APRGSEAMAAIDPIRGPRPKRCKAMAAAAFGARAMLAPAGQRTTASNRRATSGRTLTIVRRFAFRVHDGKMKSWKENRNRRKLYFFRKRKSPPMITGRH